MRSLSTQVAARGRWGYRGLRTVLAVRRVTPAVGIAAGRVLRRWYRTQVRVQRVDHAAGRVYYRSCRKRKRLFRHNRGFLTVNDGPAFVFQLAATSPVWNLPSMAARLSLPLAGSTPSPGLRPSS